MIRIPIFSTKKKPKDYHAREGIFTQDAIPCHAQKTTGYFCNTDKHRPYDKEAVSE